MKSKKELLIGYTGMLILQSNSMPLIYQALINSVAINLLTPIMTICGLSCYLYYSVRRKDTLYTIGNSIGITSSLILIFSIVF